MDNQTQLSRLFDGFSFTEIFKTFRLAAQPSRLIIVFLAVAVLGLTGWVIDLGKTVVARPDVARTDIAGSPIPVLWQSSYATELHCYLAEPKQIKSFIEQYKHKGARIGVFYTLRHFSAARFHDALVALLRFDIPAVFTNAAVCAKAVQWAFSYHLFYSATYFVIALAVICVAGGAICRSTALQFARDERPALAEALHFSLNWKRFVSFFCAPLAPLGIILLVGSLIFLLGLIGNVPWLGELIIGLGLIIALIAGVLITLVLILTIGGANLIFPAIAFEDSDSLDAISRALSYVCAKPWHMGFYTAVAAVYGAICYIFVRFFTFLLFLVTHWFLRLGVRVEGSKVEGVNKLAALWPEPNFFNLLGSSAQVSVNWSESLAAFLVHLTLLIVVALLISFVISFYFSANTIIYALMRNRVDGTILQDIHTGSQTQKEALDREFPQNTCTQTEQKATESESEEQSQTESDSAAPPDSQ